MGFASGFTGSVTLTLSLAYLTVLAHQRNRERQSAILRANTLLVSKLTDPLPPPLPATIQRAHVVEEAKDRWNAELEGAVRWAQTKDWDEVREGLEMAVGRLWARTFGGGEEEVVRVDGKRVSVLKSEAWEKAEQSRAVAKERMEGVAAAAKSAYADAKAKAGETVEKGHKKAEEVKGGLLSSIKEALGAGMAKAEGVKESTVEKADGKVSPVERALQQRYEKPSEATKSVEELLAERYTPVDERDNGVLRGL